MHSGTPRDKSHTVHRGDRCCTVCGGQAGLPKSPKNYLLHLLRDCCCQRDCLGVCTEGYALECRDLRGCGRRPAYCSWWETVSFARWNLVEAVVSISTSCKPLMPRMLREIECICIQNFCFIQGHCCCVQDCRHQTTRDTLLLVASFWMPKRWRNLCDWLNGDQRPLATILVTVNICLKRQHYPFLWSPRICSLETFPFLVGIKTFLIRVLQCRLWVPMPATDRN